MKPQRLLVPALLIVALAAVVFVIVAPRVRPARTLSGYVEGEPLYLAAPVAGTVRSMLVSRGDEVAASQPLFVVDPDQLRAQRDEAAAQVGAAQAGAQDARKGQRPLELAVFEANIAAARARAEEAGATLRRVRPLVQKGFYAPARLDDAQTAYDAAMAQVAAARRQRDAAALGAREDQVQAADAKVRAAAAALQGADARLAQVSPVAPVAARVEDTFFQAGEWAAANAPILALLPNDRIRLRFFVPEATVSLYRIGGEVRFACDGCAQGLTARITYVSPRPEYTPPVIYSRENRDRLVYLIEARPNVRLNPGQPVDVTPLGAAK